MGFIDSIKDCLRENLPCEPCYRAVMFGQSAVYLENVLGIKCYSKEEILLFVKNGELKVFGSDMYIRKFCQGDLAICGKIKGIEKL